MFLTAMERELGIEKEATTGSKIHDACSSRFNCFRSSYGRVYVPTATPTKPSPEGSALRYAGDKANGRK